MKPSALSIKAKIIVIIAFLFVAMIFTGTFAFVELRAINASAQEIQTTWLPSVRWMSEMRIQAARYRAILRDHMLISDSTAKENINKTLAARVKEYTAASEKLQPLLQTAEERAQFAQLDKLWKAYLGAAGEVIELSGKGDFAQAVLANTSKATPPGREMDDLLGKLVASSDNGAARASERASADYGLATAILLGTVGLSLLLSLCVATYVLRSITRGIESVIRPMQALADGDLSAQVPTADDRTEIGRIADKLQVFKAALIAKQESDAAAAKEAARKVERAQRIDQITSGFETMISDMVASLSSASTELEATTGTLIQSSDTAQRLSVSAASASEEVSQNVQSVAGATEEITSSVSEISRQVQEASRVAREAVRQAEQTDVSIAELSQSAARIGDVVKLITAVAGQTNLLALNATIEAARAGEAGRGFAVVASEVKALASQTAKATEEINAQIEAIQSATTLSVNNIREISQTITQISEISASISVAVEQQGAATQEIARNVQTSAQLSIQVASNVSEVSRGTEETGSASNEVLSAAKSLSVESTRLKVEVDKFLKAVRAA